MIRISRLIVSCCLVAGVGLGQESKSADRELRLGRALFATGRYDLAAAKLAPVAEDPAARPRDLYRFARSHEALHTKAMHATWSADTAAQRAEREIGMVEIELAKLRAARRHTRAARGTVESVVEFRNLEIARTDARRERTAQRDAAKQQKQIAARHFEKAYSIFQRLEREDVTRVAGVKNPGRWAEAARVGREMMEWRKKRGRWIPPVAQSVATRLGSKP